MHRRQARRESAKTAAATATALSCARGPQHCKQAQGAASRLHRTLFALHTLVHTSQKMMPATWPIRAPPIAPHLVLHKRESSCSVNVSTTARTNSNATSTGILQMPSVAHSNLSCHLSPATHHLDHMRQAAMGNTAEPMSTPMTRYTQPSDTPATFSNTAEEKISLRNTVWEKLLRQHGHQARLEPHRRRASFFPQQRKVMWQQLAGAVQRQGCSTGCGCKCSTCEYAHEAAEGADGDSRHHDRLLGGGVGVDVGSATAGASHCERETENST